MVTRQRTALLLALGAIPGLGNAAMFEGVRLVDGWPTSFLTARADWTSDNGPDYGFGFGDDGFGSLTAGGDGTYWLSRPAAVFDSGYSLGYELLKKGGGAGDTFSGGTMSFGQAANVDETGIQTFHLYSELGVNNPGWGISTETQFSHYYAVTSDYAYQPIYWAMDWVARLTTTGETYAGAWVNGVESRSGGAFFPPHDPLGGGYDPGTQTFSGSDHGVETWYPYNGQTSYPLLQMGTYIGDYAEHPGEGRLDLWVRLRFSSTPIDSVPEPATLGILVVGLAGAIVQRRRRAPIG